MIYSTNPPDLSSELNIANAFAQYMQINQICELAAVVFLLEQQYITTTFAYINGHKFNLWGHLV